MPSVPVLTVVKESLSELNVIQAGASIPNSISTIVLSKLNQIIDRWNAQRSKIWCETFHSFTLTPSLSPHTIGPSGATWTTPIRPVSLEGCFLDLQGTNPPTYTRIDIIDYQAYQALSVPLISTAIPTAVYLEEDWPNGKLFFYPVPNAAYPVRLTFRTTIGVVTLADNLDMPPGYQTAMTLTLSEDSATFLGRAVPLKTSQGAAAARALIGANNTPIPLLDLRDGQQERKGVMTDFNYHSRGFN